MEEDSRPMGNGLMELGACPAIRSPGRQHVLELLPALGSGSGANGTKTRLLVNGRGITDNGT